MRATVGYGRIIPVVAALVVAVAAGAAACGEANRAPVMERVTDQTARVGETLTLVVRAQDPDGDPLVFYIAGKPPGATFTQDADSATFRWSPAVTDGDGAGRAWPVTVSVQDSGGAWVSQDFTITVYLQGGVPLFLNPPGYVLDLATDPYLAFRIEVKDDDSTAVALTLTRSIDGAIFREEGPKAAVFYWEPTSEQVGERAYWSIVAVADDGDHEPVVHEISIILLNAAAARDCPGQPPSLRHTPLGDQRDQAGYALGLEAFDVESDVRFPTLFWAEGAAPDAAAFRPVALQADPDQPGTWRTVLPAVQPEGDAGFVSYYFTASDNDDLAADRCDHVARLPKSGTFTFAVYGPGSDPGLCLQDDAEPNESQAAAAELPAGPRSGLRLCPGDVDWFRTAAGPDVRGTFTLRHAAEHGELRAAVWDEEGRRLGEASQFGDRTVVSVPPAAEERVLYTSVEAVGDARLTYGLDVELSQTPCADDPREPDDAVEQATVVEAPGATFADGTVCADPDWFIVAAGSRQHLTVTLDVEPLQGDLDLAVLAPDNTTELAKVERTGVSHEELSLNLDQAGAYAVLVYSAEGRNGAYSLAIELRDQSESCQDDALAPNQDRPGAVMLPEATWDDLTLCPGRPDWYQIGLNGGETLQVAALAADTRQAFTLTLFDPPGATALAEAASADGWAELAANIPGPGDYPIRVEGAGASAFAYQLALWADEAPGPCAEDRLAPNHTAETAAPVTPVFTTRLRTCGGTPDWYRFEAPPETSVLVLLEVLDGDAGMLGFSVYDRSLETPIAEAREPGRTSQVVEFVTDVLGGTYFIEVSPAVAGEPVVDQHYDLGLLVD